QRHARAGPSRRTWRPPHGQIAPENTRAKRGPWSVFRVGRSTHICSTHLFSGRRDQAETNGSRPLGWPLFLGGLYLQAPQGQVFASVSVRHMQHERIGLSVWTEALDAPF